MDMVQQSSQDGVATLDLSGCGLRKLDRAEKRAYQCLILDRNELTRLESIETYGDLYKLSAAENKLVRMYGICKFLNLRVLNLSKNNIVAIEGLRELIHLRWLNLSGNKLKTVEHLGSNVALEYLDLSNNCISTLSDISNLKLLQILLLDYNNMKVLGGSSSYFPKSIATLSLTHNNIADLNQVCHLGNMVNLVQLSINHNPCIAMTGNAAGFDYRPFIINWCPSLKLLDGFVVTSKESLKGEWLYSMGKGRHFQPDEHAELVEYLSSVCPLTAADNAISEEDAKLTRILSKRHQHQQQLLVEMSISSTSSADSDQAEQASVIPKTKPEEDSGYRVIGQRPCGWMEDDVQPLVILSPPEAPSDVPELGQDLDSDGGAAVARLESLQSETQYVPVPETMLSPDFRPVSAVPSQFNIFEVAAAAATTSEDLMTRSWESATLPRWLQRSSIPRSMAAASLQSPRRTTEAKTSQNVQNRRSYPSLTDSPILRRPTQVQRLQHSSRPVSLSPSCGRRPSSSTSSTKSSTTTTTKADESGTSDDDDDSADSDVSLSKLSKVKQVAQLRHKAFARKAPKSSKSTVVSGGRATKPRSSTIQPPSTKKANKMNTESTNEDLVKKDPQQETSQDKAARLIQALWRGFRVRNLDVAAGKVRQDIRLRRAEDHVRHLQDKLGETQRELENEKRLRSLQMEAIRALWKEVQSIQSPPPPPMEAQTKPEESDTVPKNSKQHQHISTTTITDGSSNSENSQQKLILQLIVTCNSLHKQVQHLQVAVNNISSFLTGSYRTQSVASAAAATTTTVDGSGPVVVANGDEHFPEHNSQDVWHERCNGDTADKSPGTEKLRSPDVTETKILLTPDEPINSEV